MRFLAAMMGVVFTIMMLVFGGLFFSILRSLGKWNRVYQRLGKRYAAKQSKGGVFYGYLLTNPGMAFDYGRTYCHVKNRKTLKFNERRQTELLMVWPDRRFKLEISTSPARSRNWGTGGWKSVELNDPQFEDNFFVSTNQPEVAEKLLSSGVRWQLEQLRRHTGNLQLVVSINRGTLSISKPGYIKDYQLLDDYIRYSLELFDQMMLSSIEGIEFVRENEAAVVSDVKCPICSEEIIHDMVVCTRCKTPHCLDCWQYNGQCATFACSETRFVRVGSMQV
jgi:hypothetical protein